MNELKTWILEQAQQVEAQHKTLGDDRLILQGRHEALEIILQKITSLETSASEASLETTD